MPLELCLRKRAIDIKQHGLRDPRVDPVGGQGSGGQECCPFECNGMATGAAGQDVMWKKSNTSETSEMTRSGSADSMGWPWL